MKRNYIGLACTGHDNALSIVNSAGEITFAEATERYLQNKRALSTPPDDLIRIEDLINEYCEPDAEIVVTKTWSRATPEIFKREEQLATERLNNADFNNISDQIAQNLDVSRYVHSFAVNSIQNSGNHLEFRCQTNLNRKVINRSYNHHYTHAATACYTSPFEEAVCAVIDGFGEGVSTSFYTYRNGAIEHLASSSLDGDISRSLGVFYGGLLCGLCGFDVWQGEEWKVMGLAPYGTFNERIYELMRQHIGVRDFGLECPPEGGPALTELAAFARKPGASAEQVADLAYTGQRVFSELVTELLSNLYNLGLSNNLVVGGGCALNSAYNGKILDQTKFENLHVYSAPGDDGNAVGAALLAFYDDNPDIHPQPRYQSPYLGSKMSDETIGNLKKFGRINGLEKLAGKVHRKAAELLSEGKIIGWVQGRAEFGPRALGNRSILADPRPADMKDRINALVKFREEFRPFAPSILHEFGDAYFIDYQESPYMERTLLFREEVRSRVPAVVHVDGTGRLQSVKREWNERYYDLIKEFYGITGVPIVLNTSFNIMGKPIIHSVEDAIAMFYTTGLDALIIGDYLIEKD